MIDFSRWSLHDLCRHVWRWRASTNLGWAANRAMRDLNHRLAAGHQASPAPSSSLCFNPAGSAARQDTNAAQGRTRTRLLRRLHEHGIDGYVLRSWIFVSGEARFVSRGLPRTEGWNGAAAFDEGRWRRNVKWKPNRLQFDLQVKTATRHSSGKAARQAAAFRGRAQRKSNLPAHMEQYMWNRGDADKSRFRA